MLPQPQQRIVQVEIRKPFKNRVCGICQVKKFEFVLNGEFQNYCLVVCHYCIHLVFRNSKISICPYCYGSGKCQSDPLILRHDCYFYKACNECQYITLFQDSRHFSILSELADLFIAKFSQLQFFYQYNFLKLKNIFITILILQRFSSTISGWRIPSDVLKMILDKQKIERIFQKLEKKIDQDIQIFSRSNFPCQIKYKPINLENWI